jgi:hypothetical protein
VLSDGIVKAAVLCSHGKPVAPWNFVETHRDFDQHAIQVKKVVQHFGRILWAENSTAQFASFLFVVAGHCGSLLNHCATRDSGSKAGREIETIDQSYRGAGVSVSP